MLNQMWASLGGVIALQVLAVHGLPAQLLFGTTALTLQQWIVAASVASLALSLDEARQLANRLGRPAKFRPVTQH